MVAPKGFVMSAVMTPFVADDAEESVPLPVEDAPKRDSFRERDLGGVFDRSAVVEHGSG
jgi:hypothetical protein